ncbi:rRNA maturation RNase YbeY [Gordonibacter sp. Marseille-P4307]|uniref:rRNA maturation RNase YbeY n=1 Tax=Gordonibacter sp. Marseille-P4307 TaxID=2161815 RepID=UPI000F520A6C|nr:rRNA maturation RNase YbeY [Gordonibacter sp. Marseille-P4307]
MDVSINCPHRPDAAHLIDIEGITRLVVESEGKPACTEVSVNFVTDEEIHRLNLEYRGIDRPTDVLSFECDGVSDAGFDVAEADVYELGDIVIAPDVCERQAAEFGTTLSDELSLMLVHGLLHLCGYDHCEDGEAEQMERRERELLSSFYGRPFAR